SIELASAGLMSRGFQALWLGAQLGDERALKDLNNGSSNAFIMGVHDNPLKKQIIKNFAKHPPYDKYGMLPFLDELISTDWIIDPNEYDFIYDIDNDVVTAMLRGIDKGKYKDPRDVDSTPESRWEFDQEIDAYKEGSA
ncbi:hypothetical protein H2279_08760, partial [Campylobacter sp. B0100352/1]|nr:hypothetical protein [Campylobacter sp. B0100352/1]